MKLRHRSKEPKSNTIQSPYTIRRISRQYLFYDNAISVVCADGDHELETSCQLLNFLFSHSSLVSRFSVCNERKNSPEAVAVH